MTPDFATHFNESNVNEKVSEQLLGKMNLDPLEIEDIEQAIQKVKKPTVNTKIKSKTGYFGIGAEYKYLHTGMQGIGMQLETGKRIKKWELGASASFSYIRDLKENTFPTTSEVNDPDTTGISTSLGGSLDNKTESLQFYELNIGLHTRYFFKRKWAIYSSLNLGYFVEANTLATNTMDDVSFSEMTNQSKKQTTIKNTVNPLVSLGLNYQANPHLNLYLAYRQNLNDFTNNGFYKLKSGHQISGLRAGFQYRF